MGRELNVTISKLKELDEMKRDFVAGVTHDLRSPLDSIQSVTDLMKKESGHMNSEEQSEYLQLIGNNTRLLRELIDDLLTAAHLESNRQEFEREPADIREITIQVARAFEPVARQKNLAFHLQTPPKELWVWADRSKVVHVLNNLLSNAFKFTKVGSISLQVVQKRNEAEIRITDSGSGIPAAYKQKIFEKFFRSPTDAKKVKGTGLGLFIAKKFVEGQGGRIAVADNAGGGSIFSFTLPILDGPSGNHSSLSNR
jgi:signal transduction histidine kinase